MIAPGSLASVCRSDGDTAERWPGVDSAGLARVGAGAVARAPVDLGRSPAVRVGEVFGASSTDGRAAAGAGAAAGGRVAAADGDAGAAADGGAGVEADGPGIVAGGGAMAAVGGGGGDCSLVASAPAASFATVGAGASGVGCDFGASAS